jgi:DNA polymerase III subunit beta
MKLTTRQSTLSAMLSQAGRAVPSRTTMPILGNVLLTAGDRALSVAATNMSKHIVARGFAQVQEVGEITVPARNFSDFIASLPDGEVTLTLDNGRLGVKGGAASATFPTVSADEFPILTAPTDGFDVPDLARILSRVAFSASDDSSHPVLTGVLFEVSDGELALAAADGFRLAIETVQLDSWRENSTAQRWIVPADACDDVARMTDATLTFSACGFNAVAFEGERVLIGSQLIDGSFPDVKRIIPASVATRVVVDRQAMLQAVKRAAIFARDVANIVTLDCREDGLTVAAESSESGQGITHLDADREGDGLEIAFNAKFLIDALNAADTDEVRLGFNAATAPMMVTETGAGTWQHVIMPMHLGKR